MFVGGDIRRRNSAMAYEHPPADRPLAHQGRGRGEVWWAGLHCAQLLVAVFFPPQVVRPTPLVQIAVASRRARLTPKQNSTMVAPTAGETGVLQRRRSNRPGNSQATGPQSVNNSGKRTGSMHGPTEGATSAQLGNLSGQGQRGHGLRREASVIVSPCSYPGCVDGPNLSR